MVSGATEPRDVDVRAGGGCEAGAARRAGGARRGGRAGGGRGRGTRPRAVGSLEYDRGPACHWDADGPGTEAGAPGERVQRPRAPDRSAPRTEEGKASTTADCRGRRAAPRRAAHSPPRARRPDSGPLHDLPRPAPRPGLPVEAGAPVPARSRSGVGADSPAETSPPARRTRRPEPSYHRGTAQRQSQTDSVDSTKLESVPESEDSGRLTGALRSETTEDDP